MNEEVRKDILLVLKKVQPLLSKENANELKFLSNATIHNAGIFQNTDSISISIIVFSLSEIFNRPRLTDSPQLSKFKDSISNDLFLARTQLEKHFINEYRTTIKKIFERISSFENKFGMYLTQVLQYSKIKRGGRIYEHGFSAGQAANLLGITKWELMSYLGETKLSDLDLSTTITTKKRLENTRRLFAI
jgi:hypothetical protein